MAGKEATVYILDLGETMAEKRYGRSQTDLEWAMEYVWDKITTTVSPFLMQAKILRVNFPRVVRISLKYEQNDFDECYADVSDIGRYGQEDRDHECCWIPNKW